MDTNDLQDKASCLLRALEDGDAQRARDMLHGEDALEVALTVAIRYPVDGSSLTDRALADVLDILAAERMARETLARATGGIVRDLAALDHGRAVADLYATDEDVEARR